MHFLQQPKLLRRLKRFVGGVNPVKRAKLHKVSTMTLDSGEISSDGKAIVEALQQEYSRKWCAHDRLRLAAFLSSVGLTEGSTMNFTCD